VLYYAPDPAADAPGRADDNDKMNHHTEDAAVLQKTRELCQAILDQPTFSAAWQNVATFVDNEQARAQYHQVINQGEELHRKQHDGQTLSPAEVAAFEDSRGQLLQNPVARAFLDAQEHMRQVHQTVNDYVAKTLELGRLPAAEDFETESCGEGCGCHHH
jgi:cell fate (sporulation/competence/biofilm development) regulator YlbF (YheA/YmcA/DUF963 family)